MSTALRKPPLHFGIALISSFVIFVGGFAVEQSIRWTDHFLGVVVGMVHAPYFSISWGLFFLPWNLLIYGLYRWRKWSRFRTLWILLPVVVAFLLQMYGLIENPPTPTGRIKRFAKASLPEGIGDLQYHFSGGGISDYSDTYYFRCTPADIDLLVSEMKLHRSDRVLEEWGPIVPLKGAPDPRTWEGAVMYERDDDGWSFMLIANHDRSAVYIHYFCI